MSTWRPRVAMPMRHTGILAYGMYLESATRFGRDPVDMHGSVTTLGRNIFVQGVPCHPLDVMGMFGNLTNTFT